MKLTSVEVRSTKIVGGGTIPTIGPTYSEEVLTDSPTIYLKCNDPDGSNPVADSSGNGYNDVGLIWTPIYEVPGFAPDGENAITLTPGDWFQSGITDLGSIIDPSTKWSFDLVVKLSSLDDGWLLFAGWQGIVMSAVGGIRAMFTDDTFGTRFGSYFNPVLNQKYHIAATYEGSTDKLILYINGEAFVTDVLGGDGGINPASVPASLLAGLGFNSLSSGTLSNLAWYNDILLSPERVAAHAIAAGFSPGVTPPEEVTEDGIVLSFKDPHALNPYNAVAIEGLDTDLIIPKYYGTGIDSKLYNLVRKKRTVVLQAGLNPNFSDLESYSALRDDLYRLISASRTGLVQLRFKNGDVVVAALSGFVSKFETDQFDRDQEIKLTLECRDPMLKSLDQVTANFYIPTPGVLEIQDDKSTAPHGFSFIAEFKGTLPIFRMSNEQGVGTFIIRPRTPFIRNDRLHFSSDFNNKYLYMVRNGVVTHLADVLDLNPIWPIIFPGLNVYQIYIGTSIHWQSITHYETYWGV